MIMNLKYDLIKIKESKRWGCISSLGGSAMIKYGANMDIGAKVAVSSAIGGTAEALGGGKFANGAVTGAYVMMFNHLMHDWHPTRTGAAKLAKGKTSATGNETSVLVYEDDSGNDYYWVSPHDPRNGKLISYWVEPPPAETSDLTLVEEFHYSVKDGPRTANGDPTLIMGSWEDWRRAFTENIRVTHHTIGLGSWYFEPTKGFTQPRTIFYYEYRGFDKKNPVMPPWKR